jgi:hypothetical protein
MNTQNYTDTNSTTNNGTNIIIKQVFITVDPDTYVTWDALFMFIIQTMLWYFIITMCIRSLKRRIDKNKETPVAAVIVHDAENGTARLVQVTDE